MIKPAPNLDGSQREEARLNPNLPAQPIWIKAIRRVRTTAVWLVLALPFATGLVAEEVARVGRQSISVEQVRQTVVRGGYSVFEPASAERALEEAIQFELLAEGARRAGYDRDPEVLTRLKQILVERFVADRIDGPLRTNQFSEDTLKAYYEAHREQFSQPALVQAQVLTILVARDQDEAALAKARRALELIKEGQEFAAVVAEFSDDPSERVNRGTGTWLARDAASRRYPPEVTGALETAPIGEWLGPIQTGRAVYLARSLARREGAVRSFEEVRPAVARAVAEQTRREALDRLLGELRQQIPVTVEAAKLPQVVEQSVPGGGPPLGPAD